MNLKTPSILIIDDLPQNIQVLGAFLSKNNYNISFATSAKEAISLIDKHKYDLILMDIMMPEMNGYELCEKLKNNDKTIEIPVLFITAKSDSESIVKGFKAGAVDYVTKPINYYELLSRVQTHLKLYHQAKLLQNANTNLEKVVLERTEDLQKANEKLSELEKTKSDFLKLISHELRTPISGISLLAELLECKLKNSEHSHYIENLKKSADRLIDISEIALLITTLNINNCQLCKEHINIESLIKKCINKYYIYAQDKNIEIKLYCNSEYEISADPRLIEKCFEIIIDNSIKFSTACTTVEINVIKNSKNYTIDFIDEGLGFEKDNLNSIYDYFKISDINHHGEGFGLGLKALKMILDTHSAKIEIFNNKNKKGATVRIVF